MDTQIEYMIGRETVVAGSDYVFMFKTWVSTQKIIFIMKILKMIYSYSEVVRSRGQNNNRNTCGPRGEEYK